MPASNAAHRQLQPGGAQGRDRRAGILELMAAVKLWRRQIEQAVVVLINQAPAFLGRGPVLARDAQRRLHAAGLPLDHRQRLAHLAGDHRRHAALEDAGFFRGDLLDGIAEEIAMIDRHRRDDAHKRPLDHIGGVEPAAEPDFEKQDVGRVAREQQKRRRGLDLEYRDRRVAVPGFAFGQRLGQRGIVDELAAAVAADAEALVETDQIGRGIDMHALAGRFQDRAHEGDGRAFAVGAGDMDQRRQLLFGMIERGKQALDAVERQVDALGMQRQEPRQDGVDRPRAGTRRLTPAPAGSRAIAAHSRAPWSTAGTVWRWLRASQGDAPPCRPCRGRADTRLSGIRRAIFRGWSAR